MAGSTTYLAGSTTDDISEDVIPLPARLDEGLESEIGAMGIDDETRERHSDNDNEPVMEELKGDSVLDENTSETSSVISDISFPHDHWSFNKLLLKISKDLSKEDLKYLKEMFKNEIGRRVLETIDEPIQLFDRMQTRTFLSPVNLLQLQGLLWDIEKKDLFQLVVEYAQRTKNVVYMHPATDQPVNGYRHVKFHISGTDFTKMKKKELWHIRAVVASILAMSPKFVLIDGVDPSTSVTVTLLLPDIHAAVLRSMLQEDETEIKMLVELGVDKITLDGESFKISDLAFDSYSDEELQKQNDIFGKYQDAKKVVSALEEEAIELKKEIETLKTEIMVLKANSDVRKGCILPKGLAEHKEKVTASTSRDQNSSENENIGKALENFSEALKQTSEAGFEKQLVLKLLKSHVTIIATRCFHELSSVIAKQNQQVQELLSCIVINKALFEVRRYMGDGSDDEPAEIKALKDISKKLQPSERAQLEKSYDLTNDDKEVIREGSVPFLLIILHKEFQRSENVVNIIDFLRQLLTQIGRSDLLLQFHTERVRYEQERKTKNTEHEGKKKSPAKMVERTVPKDREQKLDDMVTNMKQLMKDVEAIKTTLEHITEKPCFENVANMKSEYLNLIYRTPTVPTS